MYVLLLFVLYCVRSFVRSFFMDGYFVRYRFLYVLSYCFMYACISLVPDVVH